MTSQWKFKKWCTLVGLDIKEHQLTGFDWCYSKEVTDDPLKGGILCDEMGLGKTILMMGCIMVNPLKHTLIVVPPALLDQWQKCIEKFLLHNVFVYHGANVGKTTLEDLKTHNIVLTSYGMIATRFKPGYRSLLWNVCWDRIICDEAHHLRNSKTNVCQGAARLVANIKWMVTGTPIQNKTSDIKVLFTLMGKLLRGAEELLEYIKKYVLRRTKLGVGINLPVINENVIVQWESKREENMAASIHSVLNFSGVSVDNVNVLMDHLNYDTPLPLFVRARQVCIDSSLLESSIKRLKEDGLIPADFKMTKILTKSKISAVIKKIKSEPKELNKIIFSYYRKEIDMLAERLRKHDYSVGILDGRTKKKDKVTVTQPSSQPDILIVQIQSGSEGLNLQHFSQVYFTSPHWNPAVEDQAIARAHRIGQTNPVQVFHFQMAPFHDGITLENYCMEVQEKKREFMKLIDQ